MKNRSIPITCWIQRACAHLRKISFNDLSQSGENPVDLFSNVAITSLMTLQQQTLSKSY